MTRRTLAVLAAIGAALVLTAGAGARSSAGSLTGAGSSFVAPLVSAWIPKVDAAYGVKVTYGPIGSGGGINAITNRTVDFGASDAPLTPDQFAACKGCAQIPWALSATSLAYRGDGLPDHLKLDGNAVAGIFMGRIKKWNDPALVKLNKGKSLPNLDITVIHRSDNSGTTYNLTEYLNSVSPQWKSGVGKGVAVSWPTGVGARGSSGVAATLSQTNGGISIVNPSKRQPLAYPICTFTYVIVPTNTAKAKELKQFIRWAVTKGQTSGPKLLFSPLPKVVLKASVKTLNSVHS